jgi:hypothetical protein
VGVGTSSPSEKLDVSGKTKTITLEVTGTGSTGTIGVDQNVLIANQNNYYGKNRPNYYSTEISSATTFLSTGVYQIPVSSGTVVEDILIYTKILDSNIVSTSLSTTGGTWSTVIVPLSDGTYGNILRMMGEHNTLYVNAHYFTIDDVLNITFYDSLNNPINPIEGVYRVMVRSWDGSEIL